MRLYPHLKAYQKRVVDNNAELIKEVISGKKLVNGRQVTTSPTGSGKTFMMASIIEAGLKLPEEPNFIWLTHNKQILIQTQNEIVSALGSRVTTVYNIEQGIESYGGRVLLFNVQKGVSKKAKDWLKRWASFQGEFERKTIFVIDEADEGMSGKNMEALREVLSPDLELGFTASFKKKDNEFEFVKVDYKEVIEARMLVDSIDYQASDEVSRQEITKRALKHRQYLEDIAKTLMHSLPERYFVPKMLIQAPAKDCEVVARELQSILNLSDKDFEQQIVVHTQNSRGLDEVEDLTNVRYIIGDLMVERGWNCPEAYVLLSTKQSISKAKGIQLLGRVIRLPQADRFDEDFDAFNRGYVYISGQHSIEESARNFGANELPVLPPPREVLQVEKRDDIDIPSIVSFKDELDKDIEDKDLIPISEEINDILDEIKQKCQEQAPAIRSGTLSIYESSLTQNPSEAVDATWNLERAKTLLINALTKHLPRNYANLVITKYQIRLMPLGGLVTVGPFCKEMAKLVRESSAIRRIAGRLDYVYEPYKWPPHKLVAAHPIPSRFDRSVFPKMHLNREEERFAITLNDMCKTLNLYWVRNEPSNVKLFKGHAPDFIIFSDSEYVFVEFKGKHLLGNPDSARKNEAGQAAAAYFMIYEEEDTGNFFSKGRVGEPDEIFNQTLLTSAASSFKQR